MRRFLSFIRSWKGFAGAALLAFFLMASWGCGPSDARHDTNAQASKMLAPASFAPSHRRPIIEREGKTLLWANGDPRSEDAEWFDVTDSTIDPRLFQYGIGKDRIRAIDEPEFVDVSDPELAEKYGITDEHEVIGYVNDGEAKAYPISILDRTELVNDTVGGKPVTVGW